MLLTIGLTLLTCNVESSVSSYLRSSDQNRFVKALTSGLSTEDPASISYAVQGLNLLKEQVPNDKKTLICNSLSSSLAKGANIEVAYLASVAVNFLPNCKHIFKDSDVQVSYLFNYPSKKFGIKPNLSYPKSLVGSRVQSLKSLKI